MAGETEDTLQHLALSLKTGKQLAALALPSMPESKKIFTGKELKWIKPG